MEKLENVNLAELVVEASDALLTEKRNGAASSIKKHLQRVEQLAIDVRKLEKELKSKKEKLAKAQAKIEKIKEGDWSLLADKDDSPKKNSHNNGGSNASCESDKW
jgi:outer membrane murein-binding lipoprotein Lpp